MIRRLLATTALAGGAMLVTTSPVLANPMGGNVSAGQATISSLGQTVTIQQTSNKAVLNWASFNIAPGELTQFQQPSSSAIALNRINDVNPSSINGSLTANGNVILINPNGVVFGSGAQVNVASLIATTANISDSAFMNSATPVFNQPGNPNAQVINQGTITAAQAGLVGLVAPNVENSGTITAKLGKVQLASGDSFTLDLAGDGVSQIGVSNAVLHQLVNNGGAIVADGGTVQLTAAAARSALDSLIVNTGVIRANSIKQQNGTIILSADTPGSVITNSGTITAQGRHKHQPGGSVSLTASTIQQNGTINVSGASGGKVSIRGSTITQNGTIYANGSSGPGGTITIHASNVYSDTANTLLTTASASGTGGSITIADGLSPEASAKGDDNAIVTASGAYVSDGGTTGGEITILSGNEVMLLGAYLSSRGPLGGGNIRVGGDYAGTTGRRRAQYTEVDGNTLILADATDNGDGGQITISGTNIAFAGQASAQGGPNGGNGGTITLFAPGTNAVAGNNPADKTGQATSTVMDYGLLNAAGYGSGGSGGTVSVLADNVGIMSGAFIDASGDAGGGYVKIGGDFHGQGTTPTALNTYVDPNAWIFANAVTNGNGGNVAVWSDGSTFFSGNIVAEGGANSGNGGFVETSGHGYLDAEGYVDLTAPGGSKGTYLLDPATIEIFGNVTPAFNATDSSISLSSALQLWLDASDTSKVQLTYESMGTTASGSSGQNTITVGSNAGLVVGERIQIGGSSDTYAASVNDNASGSGIYTITNISGTTITLDANLATSPSGATLYGGYVSQLTDKSGNSNNVTQSIGANMPLWISNGQNGLGVASFNGTSDYLDGGNILNLGTNNQSTFAVAQYANPAASYDTIYAKSLYGPQGGRYSMLIDHPDVNGVGFFATTNGTPWAYTSSNPSTNATIYGSVFQRGGTLSYYTNGSLSASTAAAADATNYNTTDDFLVGAYDNGTGTGTPEGGFYHTGTINELVFYNTVLSTNAQALINQYESAKWGIALTGPGNATGESGLTGAEAQAAMASTQLGATTDGYSVFADTYLERLSATSNIVLAASGAVTIDLQGDNMALSAGKSIAITSTGGNITFNSPGTITTNNAGITLTPGSGDSIILNSSSAVTLASQGGAIDLAGAVSLGSALNVNSGGGAVTFGSTVDGAQNLTVNGGATSFGGDIGGSTPLSAVSLTSSSSLTLPSIYANSISATTTGGTSDITAGILVASGASGITLSSGRDLDLAYSELDTSSGNGPVSLTATGTAYLNAISSGTGSLTVNAGNVYLYDNPINPETGSEVAYYAFNEGSGTTATDGSGNGNTGTINGATYSTSVPSALAGDPYSLSFNGTNNYVRITNSSSLQSVSSALSISYWVDPAVLTAGIILNNHIQNNGSPISGIVTYLNTNGTMAFQLRVGNTCCQTLTSNTVLSTNTWYLVTDTWNGSSMKIYINGVLDNTLSSVTGTLQVNRDTFLGINEETFLQSSTFANQFDGSLDNVRVYNTALSASDISRLYGATPTWSVGTTNITATNNINLSLGGATLTAAAGKNVSLTAGGSIINSSAGTISASQSAGSGGNITLAANGLTFSTVPAITTNGTVTFEPDTAGISIAVDGSGSTLNITSSILSATTAGSLTFGNTSDTGVMTVDASSWGVPTTFTTGGSGSIAIAGNQTGTSSATLTFNGPVTLSGSYTVSTNNEAIDFASTVDGTSSGSQGLTVNAGNSGSATFTGEVGSNTPLGALSVTAGGGITLNAVTASSVSLNSSGGSGNIASNNSGLITATSGTITVNSGGDIDFSNIGQVTTNQAVSDTAVGNAYLNAINTGTGSLTVNANNVYLYGGGLASPTSLVAYYNFNEGSGTTAIDDSGNGNTGTLTNSPTYSSSVPGALTNDPYSLSFNGSNSYVQSSSNSGLSGNFSGTISAWVKLNNVTSSQAIVDMGSNVGFDGYGLYVGTRGNGVVSAEYYGNEPVATSTGAIAANQWAFVVITKTPGNVNATTKIYVNGVVQSNASSVSGTPSLLNGPIYIGTDGPDGAGSNSQANGLIDDVRIYNTALSAQDVANLYAGIPQWSVGTANITATNNITTNIMGTTLTAGAGHNITMTAGGSITNASLGTIAGSQSAGSGGNITLKAGTDIVLPALTMNTGGGNIILDSDTANGGGAISLSNSSALNSSGGNVILGGDESNPANIVAGTGYAVGDTTYAAGIDINDATLSSGAGNIIMNGQGYGSGSNAYGIELQAGAQANATGSGTITMTGQGGGSGSGAVNLGVYINGSSTQISVVNGNLSITGTGGNTTGGFDIGFYNTDSTIETTGTGTISLTGIGNGSGLGTVDDGIQLSADLPDAGSSGGTGTVKSTATGGGGITLIGYEGNIGGSGGNAQGTYIDGNTLSSVDGNIIVDGNTGISNQTVSNSTGNNNVGVWINSYWGTASVSSSGTATITMTGLGAGSGSTNTNYGVIIDSGQNGHSDSVTSGNGSISITGTGASTSGGSNYGVYVTGTGGTIKTTGSGSITVTGAQGGGSSSYGLNDAVANGLQTTSTGSITVYADTLSLGAANAIDSAAGLTLAPYTATNSITVDGTGSTVNYTSGALGDIAAANYTFGVTADSGVMTVDATSWSVPTTFTTGGSGSIAIAGNQTGTSSATLTFNGPVTLSGSYTVSTNNEPIDFASTVNDSTSNTDTLTVNAGSGAVTFGAAVGSTELSSLTVTGPTTLDGSVTTGSGQTYNSAVTIAGNDTLTGGAIDFVSTVVDGTSNTHSLTVSGSSVTFGGTVGGTELASLNVTGATTLDGSVTTGSGQTYNSAVTIGGNDTLTGGAIDFVSTVVDGTSNTHSLTVSGSGVTFGGAVGGTELASLSVTGPTTLDGSVTTGSGQTYNSGVTIAGNDTLTGGAIDFASTVVDGTSNTHALTVSGNSVTFGGTVGSTELASLSVTGPTTLDGSVTTGSGQTFNSAVTIGGNDTLTGGAIDFVSTVNDGTSNTHSLTVSGSSVIFGGAVGTTELASLSVTGSTTLDGFVTTGSGQTYNSAVTIGGNDTLTGGAIDFVSTLNDGTSNTHSVTVSGSSVTFGGTVGGTELASLVVTGPTTLDGSVTTGGGQTYNSAITIGANDSLTGGAIDFVSTVVDGTSNTHSLTVSGSSVTFGAAVGGTELASLNVTGATTLDGSVTTGSGQTYNNAVTIAGNDTLTGGAIDFVGAVNDGTSNTHSLTVSGSSVTFGGTVGGTELASLSVTGPTTLDGSVTTGSGQTYNSAVTIGGNDTLTGGAIDFVGAVNDGTSNTHSLTVSGSSVTFGGAVGGTELASLNVTGPTSLDGSVTTGSGQTYNSAVTIGGNDTLTGGAIDFVGAVNDGTSNTHSLTVSSSSSVTFGGAVGGTELASLSVTGPTTLDGSVTTGSGQTYNSAVTIGGNDTLTGGAIDFVGAVNDGTSNTHSLTVSGSSVTFGGAVGGTELASLNVTGPTSLGGSVTTGSGQTYNSAVTLGNDVTTTSASGGITFGSSINGDGVSGRNLTVNATSGTVAFDGAVGSTHPLASLTVDPAGITLDANVTTTGAQDYQAAVTLGTDVILTTTNSAVTFGATVDGTNTLTIAQGSGTTTFGGAVGSGTNLSTIDVSGTGNIDVNGNITTSNASVTLNGPVTLGGNSTISLGGGTFTTGSTINGDYNLNATAATFSLGGAIGGNNALNNVTLISTNGLTLPAINASTILARTTGGSPANITLNGQLTASGSGNAVVLDAGTSGGNFINNYGSSVMNLTNAGTKRWIIYSTSSGSDTPDGLTPVQTINSQTYATESPGSVPNASQNTWIYSGSTTNEGTVYITATSHSDTYGTSESTTGILNITYTCSGAGCADIAGAAALGFTGSAGTSPSGYYNAGGWTITPSQGSIAWDNGYTGTFSYVTGTLTVTPKPITISGFAVANRAYDGGASATITANGSITGGGSTSSDGKYITGDTVSLVSTGASAAFGSKNVGSEIATASGYTLSGNQAADYTLTLPTAVATIGNPVLPLSVELQISYTGMAQEMPGTNSGQLAAVPNSLAVATLDPSLPPEILTPLSGSDDRDNDKRIEQPACSPSEFNIFHTSHHDPCGAPR